MKRALIIIVAMFAVSACDKANPRATPEAPVGATPASATKQPEASAPAGAKPASDVAEADARAAFEGWLKAQNESDFEAYSAAYGARFEGIKRVGPKTFKYDREGWLEDRARMFKKNMSVSADDLRISTSAKGAVVSFVQTWESGTFKDVGPKQLVLGVSGRDLRIAREEMLESTVVGTQSAIPAYDPDTAALVVAQEYYVLDPNPEDIGTGEISPNGNGLAPSRAVDTTKLRDHAGWVGKKVEVFDAGGKACAATIEEVVLFATVTPHFGEEQFWREENKSAQFIAEQIWGMAEGRGVVLAGRLSRSCDAGIWGRPSGVATSEPIPGKTPGAPLTSHAIAAFRKLPGYHAIQNEYGSKEPWDLDENSNPTVTRFGDHVVVTATAGQGCGQFFGEFWGVWEIRGDDLVLMSDPDSPGAFVEPVAAWTANGKVNFVGNSNYEKGSTFVEPVGAVWRPTTAATFPYLDCPC